ncbi:MAG: DNA-binding protein [Chloroflexota bacterium]
MTSITIPLTDDLMLKLKKMAEFHKIAPEELVRATVEDLIMTQSDTFDDALDLVLAKNEELYQRLAK